ncbi:MAG TPA: flagellar biosynthetic protein FliO [Miltoncostaeaceae bacterium]|nr:flagellar biosynthetic protein FliO [Miltoncostaeaceae bacterium]
MVTLTPTRHGSPDTRRRTRPAARLGSAVGRLTALVLAALALALAAAPAMAQTTTAGTTTAASTATAPASSKGAKGVPVDPNEKLPIPEGSDNPVAMSGGAGGTLIRLVVGLGIVVGLIGGVWYVLKRVQRSRYPGMDDRNPAGLIDVLATTSLGPNRSLHLVKVGEEIVLVGSTDHQVAPITRIGAEDAAGLAGAAAPQPTSFRGDPGAAARTRAQKSAADQSVVDRLRAMTARR